MPVNLRVKLYREQPPEAPLSCLIEGSGSLGRGPDNDLVLNDPGKYISRTHSRIEAREAGYVLIDVGSNPSVINERLLGNGRETALQDGDQLVIGDYCIEVSLLDTVIVDADQTGVGNTQTLAVFMPPPALSPAPLPPLETAPALRSDAGFSRPEVQTDALAAAGILRGPSALDPTPQLADPLGLNLFAHGGYSAPGQVFDEFGSEPSDPRYSDTPSDHVSPELQALPPSSPALSPSAGRSLIPDDYDALADLMKPVMPTTAMSAPSDPDEEALPEIRTPTEAPATPATLVEPAPIPPTAAPTAAPSTTSLPPDQPDVPSATGDAAVLRALLDGLGLPDLRTSRSPEALARLVGEMLRAATGGTMDVLMARALTKRESHIDMTMIGARSNNPLKFFPDPASALSQMLTTDAPAYLPATQALEAAFEDLKAHELAVIAGMREALNEVVQRLEPGRIDSRLAAPGALDKLMPGARKARLWQRFTELYSELVRDGNEDLQRIFGETFSTAYQQQVTRLRETP